MASIAAKAVAEEVLETMRKGKIPSVLKIAPKHGYSVNTANAGLVQKTKTYQAVMSPVVTRMEKERDRLLASMEKDNLSYVEYSDKTKALDTLTKNIQLLSGGSTANIAIGRPIYGGQSISGQPSNEKDILPA